MVISSFADAAEPGQHTVSLPVPVPYDAPKEAVYIVVTLTPAGASWEGRLAEDRTYKTKLAGMRMLLRQAVSAAGEVEGELGL